MITCGFVGLGLIGGSIARALKANRKDIVIIACDPNEETLKLATEQKIADEAYPAPCDAFTACDYIFLCAPVSHNDENLLKILSYRKKDCILTDVGSVKTPINSLIHSLGLTDCFIGGHPMAAIPLQVESQKHDYVTAAVSHLPHIVAAALVHLVQDHDDAQGLMKSIAAGGFKDITRIASSSPVMWEQICMTNTVNISRLLQDYIDALGVVQKELQEHDSASLYTFFDGARAYRDSFIDAGSGPIKKDYSIRLDIPDEAGSIAAVSTLLALNNISIKNIGIVHNREAQEGVLRIEFYEEDSITKAIQLLNRRGYVTHI